MLSEQDIAQQAAATGFPPETLEKVFRLLDLLAGICRHPFLKTRVALKGGTALNLFTFEIPRLSVDIDLNYIGATERQAMLADVPKVKQAVQARSGCLHGNRRAGLQVANHLRHVRFGIVLVHNVRRIGDLNPVDVWQELAESIGEPMPNRRAPLACQQQDRRLNRSDVGRCDRSKARSDELRVDQVCSSLLETLARESTESGRAEYCRSEDAQRGLTISTLDRGGRRRDAANSEPNDRECGTRSS